MMKSLLEQAQVRPQKPSTKTSNNADKSTPGALHFFEASYYSGWFTLRCSLKYLALQRQFNTMREWPMR